MTQAIENRAEVVGRVEQVEGDADDRLVIRLRVSEVRDVAGYPNLVGQASAHPELVFGASEVSDAPRVGDMLTCQIKLVGPGRYFALPGSCRVQR